MYTVSVDINTQTHALTHTLTNMLSVLLMYLLASNYSQLNSIPITTYQRQIWYHHNNPSKARLVN